MKRHLILLFFACSMFINGQTGNRLHLSDFPSGRLSQHNIHHKLQKNRCFGQRRIIVFGTRYGKSLGMFAPENGRGSAVFRLPADSRTFSTKIALADMDNKGGRPAKRGKVEFIVLLGNNDAFWEVFRLVVTARDEMVTVPPINLKGASQLKLMVENAAPDFHSSANSVWISPAIRK
ncbi:MAG: hypothetical protein GY765_10405 [bacterium]|nr:hypothetical protein [bacterium]